MGSKPLSEAALEARRKNSLKSTGPRTRTGKLRASANALKDGRYAGAWALHASMRELGEDPEEFARLRDDLIDSYHPFTPAQGMLVEDIASLRWERRRLERAQAALLARRVQELEIERQRMSLQITRKVGEDLHRGDLMMGVIWLEDSPAKFQRLLEWLGELQTRLDAREFTDVEVTLRCIYGLSLTLRGIAITGHFRALAEADPAAPPDASRVAILRRELLAEVSSVTQLYQLYLRKHVEITPTMREECLVPTENQRWLMRQLNMVDRQIERKTQLLRSEMGKLNDGEPHLSEDDHPGARASSPQTMRPRMAALPRGEQSPDLTEIGSPGSPDPRLSADDNAIKDCLGGSADQVIKNK